MNIVHSTTMFLSFEEVSSYDLQMRNGCVHNPPLLTRNEIIRSGGLPLSCANVLGSKRAGTTVQIISHRKGSPSTHAIRIEAVSSITPSARRQASPSG